MIARIDGESLRGQIQGTLDAFTGLQRRHAPFALRAALQRTAEEGRDAARQRVLRRGFTIRSATFAGLLANAIIIERPASTDAGPGGRYTFRVVVDSRVGKSRTLLPWLEDAGVRTSTRNLGRFGRAVAVPVRRTPMEVIPRNLYPSATGVGGATFAIPQRPAIGVQRGKRGQVIGSVGTAGRMRGKQRTFAIAKAGSSTEGTVFQRYGSGDRDIRAIFLVRPSVRVAGRKYFYAEVERVVRQRLAVNFRGMLDAALWSSEIGRRRGVSVSQRRLSPEPTRAW